MAEAGMDGNPKSLKFEIIRLSFRNGFTFLEAKYEEASTWKGIKLLVYSGDRIRDIQAAQTLDPHFLPNQSLVPIMRFCPSIEGRKLFNELKEI